MSKALEERTRALFQCGSTQGLGRACQAFETLTGDQSLAGPSSALLGMLIEIRELHLFKKHADTRPIRQLLADFETLAGIPSAEAESMACSFCGLGQGKGALVATSHPDVKSGVAICTGCARRALEEGGEGEAQ